MSGTRRLKTSLVWIALAAAIVGPLYIAARSPLLAWREPVYILAGFAGIAALALLLVQPLLAGGYLPGLGLRRARNIHRWIGGVLVASILLHVAGLWVTSPPDVVDALLFASPTPFSAWGVVAMWAALAAALLAVLHRRQRIRPDHWRVGHTFLVSVVVATTIVHAMLIEGTMGTWSKALLCALAASATAKTLLGLRAWKALTRRQSRGARRSGRSDRNARP